MTTRLNAALARHGHATQVQLVAKAERSAASAERSVRRQWNALLRIIRSDLPWPHVAMGVKVVLAGLYDEARQSVSRSLRHVAKWSYGRAVKGVRQHVPIPVVLHEDAGDSFPLSFSTLMQLLFPAFTEEQVNAAVYTGDWRERLAATTRLTNPDVLAQLVSSGLVLGKSHQEIAREIKPYVQNVVSSARRVARTECMRVAQSVQMAAHERLGDLVIGYQIHATLDHWTRKWHRARDKTIYYKEPERGQKGLHQMPNPPDEAPDPAERPPRTPKTAYNCRCFLTPVLRSK